MRILYIVIQLQTFFRVQHVDGFLSSRKRESVHDNKTGHLSQQASILTTEATTYTRRIIRQENKTGQAYIIQGNSCPQEYFEFLINLQK